MLLSLIFINFILLPWGWEWLVMPLVAMVVPLMTLPFLPLLVTCRSGWSNIVDNSLFVRKWIYVTIGGINLFLTRTVVHNVVPTHHPPLGTTYQPHSSQTCDAGNC